MKNAVSQVETWLVANNNTMTFPTTAEAITAKSELASIKVSEGVTIRITKSAKAGPVSNGYTVCGFHSNGKNYNGDGTTPAGSKTLVYKSAEGGMQKDGGACGASTLEFKTA